MSKRCAALFLLLACLAARVSGMGGGGGGGSAVDTCSDTNLPATPGNDSADMCSGTYCKYDVDESTVFPVDVTCGAVSYTLEQPNDMENLFLATDLSNEVLYAIVKAGSNYCPDTNATSNSTSPLGVIASQNGNLRNLSHYSVCFGDTVLGSGSGDPHFVGFDGRPFDYHGQPGAVFNVLSTDVGVQVNALLVPELHNGLTYMGAVGVSTPESKIAVQAHPELKSLLVTVNDIPLGDHRDTNVEHALGHGVTVKRLDAQTVEVVAGDAVALTLAMRHDQFVDITRTALLMTPTLTNIHGVLGQTAIPGRNIVGTEGAEEDYFVSSLFAEDFAFARHANGSAPRKMGQRAVAAPESVLFASAANFDF